MKTLIIISMFCLAVTCNVSGQTTPQEMLNKAIYEEEVNGNLEEAIKLYLEIVDNNSTNRTVTAEAFYHLGLTNEKLGNKKAKEYYQKIVSNFGDQPEFVRIAKERLSKLMVVEKELEIPLVPKFTKINIASNPQNGVLSPDGNRLAFFSDGAVWIVPIHGKVNPDIAGEPVLLARIPGAWDYSSLMSWSADGEWIAVNGEETDTGTDVYILNVKDSQYRSIQIPQRGGHSFSYRLSLSPDGQMLSFSAIDLETKRDANPHDRRIYEISVSGGEPKLVSSENNLARLPSYSPDGKFIAYVGYSRGNIGDLMIVPSSGGNPIKLASVDGRFRGPVWSSDGKYIAAHHEPGNNNTSKEILVYQLSSDLSTTGEPTKITLPGESYNLLAGWTPDDELGVFIQSEEHSAIYTVPATGGKAVQVSPDGQWPYYPRWSPDGKRIYFRPPFWPSKEGEVVDYDSPVLYVSAIGGNIEEVPVVQPDLDLTSRVPGGGFNISPDGKKIVISTGMEKQRKPNEINLWTISLKDGLPTRISGGMAFDGIYPCWSPDGKWIAFKSWNKMKTDNEGFSAIYIIPSDGGKIRQISTEVDDVGGGAITFSKNGEQIAFFSGSTIKTIPVEGGQSKVLVTKIKSGDHSNLAYSPDGSKIAHNVESKIWITSLEDGIPQELKTGLPKNVRLSEFGWSPNSEKIAFFCSSGGEAEFWMVGDFLPLGINR